MKWVIPLIILSILVVLVWSIPWLVTPRCNEPFVHMRADQIRVLTYNTYLLGKKSKRKRLDYFLEHYLNSFDIVCLQEVFFHKKRIIKAARKYGFLYFANSTYRYPTDSGLLILSRFPLLNTRFTRFRRSCHSDRFANKGILSVDVWVNRSSFQLINTHTQAFYNINDKKAFRTLGYQELQLVNEVNNFGPVLLCGDLNGIRLEEVTNLKRLTEELMFTGKMKYDKQGDEVEESNVIVPFELDTILYRGLQLKDHKVHTFKCPPTTSKLQHCSDHFGLSATIINGGL